MDNVASVQCQHAGHEAELRRIRTRLGKVTSYLKMMSDRTTDQDVTDAINEDWRALARIVDRLLLYVTVAALILAAVWIFIYAKSTPGFR